jgi:hypothetical protein
MRRTTPAAMAGDISIFVTGKYLAEGRPEMA